jgi:transcriptional regulator with GAF, ATPase, and Fis domain
VIDIIKQIRTLFKETSSVHISLSILVPFIFTGLGILSFIAALYAGSASAGRLVVLGIAIVACIASFSTVVTFAILNPVKKFIKTAEALPDFPNASNASNPEYQKKDDLSHFNYVFREVANILSKVDAREKFPDIIGQSRAIRSVLSQVVKVSPTDTTVLILGESGVGKEKVAEAIYKESSRLGKPFIKLNCVAIPTGLLESELFGHEKGAFTGAIATKKGKFELAHEGTLFLDEIGDMPLETQAKLLRVLQQQEFQRVGGNQTIKVNVRFIAASNKNLERMVAEGTFREDLFYRLNVFTIIVPPLRDRIEDIPLLAEHILKNSPKGCCCILASDAMRELMTYPWPGNVRELENVLAKAVVLAESNKIEETGLSPAGNVSALLHKNVPVAINAATKALENQSLDEMLADLEKLMIMEALEKCGGIQSKAAQYLGINQRSLWHRTKKYQIDVQTIKKQQIL